MKIIELRIGKNGDGNRVMEETEVNPQGLLCFEFVNNDGDKIRVRFRNEAVEIDTPSGLLSVLPHSSNAITVEVIKP